MPNGDVSGSQLLAAPPALVIEVAGGQQFTARAADGPVVIGREPPADICIPGSGVSRVHLRVEPERDQWIVTDSGSRNGTYVDGRRVHRVAVNKTLTLRLGGAAGVEVRVTPAPARADHQLADERGADEVAVVSALGDGDAMVAVISEGAARAGAAVAARREELGFTQRKLADDHVVSQSVLVKFERGVHWPRQSTIAKIESYLRWPSGTIELLRAGGPVPEDESTEILTPTVQATVMVDASQIALRGLLARAAVLPALDSPLFTAQITPLLTEVRRLERTVTTATHTSARRPELARLLGQVRRTRADMIAKAASAPAATLGQRLAAAREANCLTVAEAAVTAGVSVDDVEAVENEQALPTHTTAALQRFLGHVDARR